MEKTIKTVIIGTYNTSRFNTKTNELRLVLPTPMELQGTEVALSSLVMYNSVFNITSRYGNNSFSYIFSGSTYNLTIPDGYYTITDLNGWFRLEMKKNLHFVLDQYGDEVYFLEMASNPVYYAVTLTAMPIAVPVGGSNPNSLVPGNSPQFVFSNAAFCTFIGFNAGSYPPLPSATEYQINSQNIPQLDPINTYNLVCNLARNENMSSLPQVIYSFIVSSDIGVQIQEKPSLTTWFKCNDTVVNEIVLTLRDSQYRDINLLDVAGFTISLLFRS